MAGTVVDEGDKGEASDGLETDDQGRIYITSGENNARLRKFDAREDGWTKVLLHPASA